MLHLSAGHQRQTQAAKAAKEVDYGKVARNVPLFAENNAQPILLNPTRLDSP